MLGSITLFTTMMAMANAADTVAPEAPVEAQPTGYRDVELYDGGPTQMEDKRDYDQVVVLGPMIVPLGIKVRYLHSLSDRTTIQIGGGFGSGGFWDEDMSRILVRLGVDHQPVGNGLHGFYVGPRVAWSMLDDDSGTMTTQTRIGGAAGYRAVFDPGVSVGAGLGVGYTWGDMVEYEGMVPIAEFTLGWAF